MGKRCSSNYWLIFILGVSFLAACTKIQTPNDRKSDNTQTTTVQKIQFKEALRLENIDKELDSNYQELAFYIKAFSQEVTGKSKSSQIALSSSQASKKLEELSYFINTKLFASQAPDEAIPKLEEINLLIENIRQKVIKPTQKGWNRRIILEVQRNLGQVPTGESNKNTKSQIDKFLRANLTQLGDKVRGLELSVSQQPTNPQLRSALVSSKMLHEGVNPTASSLQDTTQTRSPLALPSGQSPNNSEDNTVTLSYVAMLLSACSVVASTYTLLRTNSVNGRSHRNRVTQTPANQSASSEIPQEHFITRAELQKVLSEWKQQMTDEQFARNKYENNLPSLATERNATQVSHRNRISQESPDTKRLVDTYNTDPGSLSNNAIEVSAKEDSITQRRLGLHQAIVLERVSRGKGNYWVLPSKDFNYLVPKKSIKINEFNYETVEALFVCNNYQPGYTHFQLCKPGKVTPVSQGEAWQLSEQGELQF